MTEVKFLRVKQRQKWSLCVNARLIPFMYQNFWHIFDSNLSLWFLFTYGELRSNFANIWCENLEKDILFLEIEEHTRMSFVFLIHEAVVITIFVRVVRTSKSRKTKQSSSENSDRHLRDCGSGRVDHWWHACLVIFYFTFPWKYQILVANNFLK